MGSVHVDGQPRCMLVTTPNESSVLNHMSRIGDLASASKLRLTAFRLRSYRQSSSACGLRRTPHDTAVSPFGGFCVATELACAVLSPPPRTGVARGGTIGRDQYARGRLRYLSKIPSMAALRQSESSCRRWTKPPNLLGTYGDGPSRTGVPI